MSTKVLVFESDAAFAGELRSELGKLGCSTCIVDDGSVGLQQASAERPDLILLSIELPRMNGFSVCNKLKKDPLLKDVPLIIMSSESSDETFEQHRKLRTRAEDYIHKPVAFGELLHHIQSFVQLAGATSLDDETVESDGIVIDDEIAVQSLDADEEDDEGTQIALRPAFPELKKRVDPEVESFADAAFGRMTGAEARAAAEPAPREINSAHERPVPIASQPPNHLPKAASQSSATNDAAVEKARADLQRVESRAADLEKELAQAREQIIRVHQEADAEAERMQRDLDELRSRAAVSIAPKVGAVSSREFLDLREALNKKDKEILSLRTQLTSKDKDIFDARDRSLVLERQISELDDKVLAKDREANDANEQIDQLSAKFGESEIARIEAEKRLGTTLSELELQKDALAEARRAREEETIAHDSRVAALKTEQEQTLERTRTDHAQALERLSNGQSTELERLRQEHQSELDSVRGQRAADAEQAEARRTSELAGARHEYEALLAGARDDAATEKVEALEAREVELRSEADSKLAALQREHYDELSRLRNEAQEQLDRTSREAGERLSGREKELETRHAEEMAEASTRATSQLGDARLQIESLQRELETWRKQIQDLVEAKKANDATNEATIGDLRIQLADASAARASLEGDLVTARDRIATLDLDLSSARGGMEAVQRRLDGETARADRAFAKWDADRTSLERAKDALAVALAELDEAEARPIREP
jgi:DNA-binding response OmpR family regulator/predicted  nucleic acid-binding Zn-ribbon protein